MSEARRRALRTLLKTLEPADATEHHYVDVMTKITESPGDPFARDHFTPGHFTASAFVLSPARDAVLLVFHGKLHRWLQPGGHFEPDDPSVLAAAQREVAEEVGLPNLPSVLGDTLLDVDVHGIPPLKGAPGHLHFDVRWLLQAPSLEMRAGSDAADARWFKLDDVTLEASDASVMRAIEKIRALVESPS